MISCFFRLGPLPECNDMVTFWLTQGGKHKVLKTYRIQTMRDENDCWQGTVVKIDI